MSDLVDLVKCSRTLCSRCPSAAHKSEGMPSSITKREFGPIVKEMMLRWLLTAERPFEVNKAISTDAEALAAAHAAGLTVSQLKTIAYTVMKTDTDVIGAMQTRRMNLVDMVRAPARDIDAPPADSSSSVASLLPASSSSSETPSDRDVAPPIPVTLQDPMLPWSNTGSDPASIDAGADGTVRTSGVSRGGAQQAWHVGGAGRVGVGVAHGQPRRTP